MDTIPVLEQKSNKVTAIPKAEEQSEEVEGQTSVIPATIPKTKILPNTQTSTRQFTAIDEENRNGQTSVIPKTMPRPDKNINNTNLNYIDSNNTITDNNIINENDIETTTTNKNKEKFAIPFSIVLVLLIILLIALAVVKIKKRN